jgi:hypothetical protein
MRASTTQKKTKQASSGAKKILWSDRGVLRKNAKSPLPVAFSYYIFISEKVDVPRSPQLSEKMLRLGFERRA